jgi:hypothetical protein
MSQRLTIEPASKVCDKEKGGCGYYLHLSKFDKEIIGNEVTYSDVCRRCEISKVGTARATERDRKTLSRFGSAAMNVCCGKTMYRHTYRHHGLFISRRMNCPHCKAIYTTVEFRFDLKGKTKTGNLLVQLAQSVDLNELKLVVDAIKGVVKNEE